MYGRSGPLTFWLAVIRAVLPRWVSTQDIGVSLDGHFRLLCPVVDPSVSGVAAPQGGFARWIHRHVRAFWPAFGRHCLPRQAQSNLVATHRVQRLYLP
jgi:hypothetical protein